jgi:hypothetical protein
LLVIGCLAASAAVRANEAPVARALTGVDSVAGSSRCSSDSPTVRDDGIGASWSPTATGAAGREGSTGATQVATATTVCRWVCYPGSGCEHVCQFFPQ